ncbi:MAG TPA: SdrD B-like domain-containing protein, partial [Saprospiraceae bacterium]|nr:SdrD B-like domain-containing protein [Saprospiraceae bacterium]
NGTEVDPNNNEDPTDNDEPTAVTFTENPSIGIAKAITSGPINNNDGTYTLTYTMLVENTGDVLLDNVQVVENLNATFTGATSYTVNNISSADFSVNNNFNGNTDTNLLTGNDNLIYLGNGSITLTVTVTPGSNLGAYNNTAVVNGTSPANQSVTDDSQNGTEVDPDNNDDPTDNDEPTSVTFTENPSIGIAKAITNGPINNNDGTYTLTYTMLVENTGDVLLDNVQVVENLKTTFAGATSYSVNNISSADFSVNNNFNGNSDTNLLDGTDNLIYQGSGSITLTITVTPGSNLGAYNNTAVVNGTSPANQSVTDDSQNGTNVDPDNNDDPTDNDEPTSVTFTENPSIGIAKAITSGPINNNDGTYTLTYTMLVENTGDVLLSKVQIVENLNATFAGATSYTVNSISSTDFSVNNNFNGNTDTNLLDGTDNLIYQGSGSITLTVTVTPGSNLGAYNNTAVANGTSPANQSVTDDSQNGTDVDPDNNDDPTDNDQPTAVTFTENPSIGIAKAITSGPINNNDGTYTLTYTMLVENIGDVLLNNVQVVENLNTTFAGATSYTVNSISSTDFSVNNNFNGSSDTNLSDGTDNLIYQGSGSITLTVTVTPGSYLGAYNNTAVVNGTSPANQSVTDDSQNGTDVDPDNNDDPTDNDEPTPVTFTENPSIGIAKAITSGPINNNDGTYTLTYTMLVENTGDVLLDNVQVVENLNTTFAGVTSYTVNNISSADFNVNNNFNGNTDTNLLTGNDNLIYLGSGSISLTVTVTPGSNLGAYNNTAVVNGISPANQSVTDNSQDGTDVDPDNNDDPTDNDEPTAVTFTENPSIGIAKAITNGPINNNDGTYTLTYTMLAENTGDVLLSNVQVVENLNTTFAGAISYTVNSISSADFSVNNNFNGNTDTNLMAGTDNLIYQGSGSITLTVTVTPGSNLGAYNNTAVANGTSPTNQAVTDNSQDGTNVDPDNNDDPTDNNQPSSITFTENPNIGISKALTNGPINKGNQTYDLEFTMILQNTGDVPLSNIQVIDDLALTFATAESFTINSVTTSANLTVNPLYNGTTNVQLLSGNDGLAYNETGTITLSVNLRPGINITPFENIAIGEGISPAGISVSDDSQDGDDIDPDNDNNPSNNGDPTPIPISAVAVLKDLTSSVLLPDGDVRLTFDLLVKNIGNVTMTDLILEDDLLMSSAFSSTPDFVVSLTNINANVPPSANASYNGVSDINLITGISNLAPSQEFRIALSFDVNPVLFSQLNNDFKKNQAVVFGTPRDQNGNVLFNSSTASFYTPREVFDASDDISGLVLGNIFDTNNGANGDGIGMNPYDNPTPITMPSSIKVLKTISATIQPLQLLNGNYRVTYDFDIINNGGQVLQSIQLEDDIAAQYGCAYVGNASVPLVSLSNNSNLSVISTVNNLFAGGGSEINMLLGDGILYPGDTIHLTTSLEINPSCINPALPLENQAITFAIDETESSVDDLSDDVTDMNNDGTIDYPGMGLDDPTPLEIPSINVVKSLTNIQNANSNIPGNKDVTYRFTIQNTGNTNLVGIDLIDQIQNQLAPVWVGITSMPTFVLSTASVTPILNPNFNGGSQANMFNGTTGNIYPGQFVTVQLTIEIDPNKDNTYPLLTNQATTNGDAILNNGMQTTVTDASDDGINPKGINPNYLGDTGTSNDPTPLIVPAISTVKNVVSYQNALSGIEGHYDVVMNIAVKNIGNVHLTNISLLDTIELTKYVGPYFVGLAPTTNPNIVNSNLTQNPTINNAFNGRLANANIFDGNSGLMAPGQAFTVQLRLELDATLPGLPDSLWNRVSAYGEAAQSDGSLYYLVSDGDPINTSDDSDAGYDHESINPNQPEDLGTSNDKTLIEVLGELGDFVWNDLNGDGIQDEGEPGLANVVVELYDCNDQFIRSVTTDGNGAFALTNVLKGQYKLKFDFSNLGIGYAFTLPNVGNNALNSDANADGFTNCFTLNAGERSDDIDAGLVQLSSIGKFVWDDLNGDGLQSPSEPGISGVTVKIFLTDGTLVDSTITSSNGQYEFNGLYPGNYYLTFTTPEGYSFTFANSGSNDAVDSDVNGANGVGTTSVFTLLPGVRNNTLNAGMYRCISIGDLVWYDLNRNDVWDSNENGINGLPVNLWRNVGGTWIIWDTKFTGFKPNSPSADGYFNFCAPPGQYYIEVIIPQLGLVRARPNIGNNEEIDSDLTNAFGPGTSASFTVTSGQQKNDLGSGYYPMAIAGNLVWQDDNQNGLQDDEEPKVAGIKVQAYDANTHLVVAEAITDEEGKYTLDYLERTDIYIKFDVPSGFSPTIARAADDAMDSDVDHSFGPNTTRMFAMESGMVNENIDLGIAFGVLPVEWLDVNASRLNNTHIVSWRTAKEVNVAYYIVERRFANETVFTEIPGRVAVNGNTNAIQAYSLIDQDVAPSGVYIYRVKQVDFDGKYTYSKLVSVQNQGEDIITLYPNPAKDEANLEISLTRDGEISVEIFDNTSKLLKVVATEQQQLRGVKSYPLNLQDMSAGIYNLKISINGVVTQKKLIRIE